MARFSLSILCLNMKLIHVLLLLLYYCGNCFYRKIHVKILFIFFIKGLILTSNFSHDDILHIIKSLNYLGYLLGPLYDQNCPLVCILRNQSCVFIVFQGNGRGTIYHMYFTFNHVDLTIF